VVIDVTDIIDRPAPRLPTERDSGTNTPLVDQARADHDDDLDEMPSGIVIPRRRFLQLGAAAAGVAVAGAATDAMLPDLRRKGFASPGGVLDQASIAWADSIYTEVYPTSPLILSPFRDELPIPQPLAPCTDWDQWEVQPGPGIDGQSSYGGHHQIWPSMIGYPDPIVYNIKLQVSTHSFTTSKVLPITRGGKPAVSYDERKRVYRAGTQRFLPQSTIYGFNGTFPGPMINAEYGKPVLIRFENELHLNPLNLDRQDFGAPDWTYLTHLHNAHTAPESDGNPHYTMRQSGHHGYDPETWCDNLYLNWPAGGDRREKQSFFWFHDHRMDHTGANVYKGMVGLYPIYDPEPIPGTSEPADAGYEHIGYRLPGVREDLADGTFKVHYDVPLAFYDCRLDDGVTTHHDMHDGMGEYPAANNPNTHPEWWGKTFFKHFPNKGFVGDIFTVNGTAFPVMEVKRRKYRFRFLDASIARIYEFAMMSSTTGPKSARSLGYTGDELQGQYRLTDAQQCMRFTEVAADGGLLPFPMVRDSFELWPAKRREMVLDFTQYQDGTPTSKGDVIYLCNIMKMTNGRMWNTSTRAGLDPRYVVPVMKIVIGDWAEDNSEILPELRPLPPLPSDWRSLMDDRMVFEVHRGGAGGEIEWLINGEAFDPSRPVTSLENPAGNTPLAQQKLNSYNLWEVRNGGGGWVHPLHIHQEEHRVVMRDGVDCSQNALPGHPDDMAREDLIALDPGEEVIIFRHFRDFVGPYVAHCHNLAHEDHAMMFGWEIIP
jgi:FtsP/CotA-like multicopper oxidase with cupredoxin domain